MVLYSGEGENIGTSRVVVELLELVVILLFCFFDTPSKICTGLCYPCLSQYRINWENPEYASKDKEGVANRYPL